VLLATDNDDVGAFHDDDEERTYPAGLIVTVAPWSSAAESQSRARRLTSSRWRREPNLSPCGARYSAHLTLEGHYRTVVSLILPLGWTRAHFADVSRRPSAPVRCIRHYRASPPAPPPKLRWPNFGSSVRVLTGELPHSTAERGRPVR
jgi:hypothetical protein